MLFDLSFHCFSPLRESLLKTGWLCFWRLSFSTVLDRIWAWRRERSWLIFPFVWLFHLKHFQAQPRLLLLCQPQSDVIKINGQCAKKKEEKKNNESTHYLFCLFLLFFCFPFLFFACMYLYVWLPFQIVVRCLLIKVAAVRYLNRSSFHSNPFCLLKVAPSYMITACDVQ